MTFGGGGQKFVRMRKSETRLQILLVETWGLKMSAFREGLFVKVRDKYITFVK